MSDSQYIRNFPTDPIEIECKKCGRRRRYRKAALIENHGNDVVLPDLLALISGDCEIRGGLGNRGCGAIYPTLSRVQKRNSPLQFA